MYIELWQPPSKLTIAFVCLFAGDFVCSFETGFFYVVLADLTPHIDGLISTSQRPACLCFPSAGIKGFYYHA